MRMLTSGILKQRFCGTFPKLVDNDLAILPNLRWNRTRIRKTFSLNGKEEPISWSVESSGNSLPKEMRQDIHVVLVSPQIPGNAGSIARTCAATSVGLHLVEPLGFEIDDTKLKRAGLDYWPFVVVKVHKSWEDFMDYFKEQGNPKRLIAFSKYGSQPYWDLSYKPGDYLLFGAETFGLPKEAVSECKEGEFSGGIARIPIDETYVRSLNLSVATGIGLYEALRQIDKSVRPLDVLTRRPD